MGLNGSDLATFVNKQQSMQRKERGCEDRKSFSLNLRNKR